MRMRHIAICSLSGSNIFLYYLKRHDFRKEVTEHEMCVLIFCTNLSETFLIFRRTERGVIKIVYWSASCKVPPDILVRF
jgi:hypothetical protein